MSNASDFIIENGVLKKYTGVGGDVVIPEGVTEIGDNAFKNKKSILSVTIPEGVVKMGVKSFAGCCNMKSIFFPSTLVEGLSYCCMVFSGCCALKEVCVAEGNPVYSSAGGILYTLLYNKKMGLIYAPENVSNAIIPEGVQYLAGGAFTNCRNLNTVDLPKSLENIGDECFQGCQFETPLRIPERVGKDMPCCRNIGVPILADYACVDPKGREQAFIGFAIVYSKNLTVSEEMKQQYLAYAKRQKKKLYPLVIENEYVRHMMLMEGIIPETDINTLLFIATQKQKVEAVAELLEYQDKVNSYTQTHLEEKKIMLDSKNISVAEIKKTWTYGKLNNGDLVIRKYKGTDEAVYIPGVIGKATVTKLNDEAFKGKEFIRSVQVPESVNAIGVWTFVDCSNLEEINIPFGVAKIDWGTFSGCKSLTKIILPDGLKEIGNSAFEMCEKLSEIHLPASVTKIAGGSFSAFFKCPKLKIYAHAGSYAEQYARENNIPFVAE